MCFSGTSVQEMELNFHDSFVSTIDLANCYPSIEIKETSRDYFNFYVESEIWHHSRLPQGWGPSLQIAQSAIIWTFKDSTLQLFILTKKLTPAFLIVNSYIHTKEISTSAWSPLSSNRSCIFRPLQSWLVSKTWGINIYEPYLRFPWSSILGWWVQ